MPTRIQRPKTRQEEMDSLESQAEYFEKALQAIRERLAELKAEGPAQEKRG
jgi:hypothetical protein